MRYINLEAKKIREDFIQFVKMTDLIGEHLPNTITQAYILKKQPLVIYVHFYSHYLNMSLLKVCGIHPVRNIIGIVEEVISFIEGSPKQIDIFKDKIKEHFPDFNTDIAI